MNSMWENTTESKKVQKATLCADGETYEFDGMDHETYNKIVYLCDAAQREGHKNARTQFIKRITDALVGPQ